MYLLLSSRLLKTVFFLLIALTLTSCELEPATDIKNFVHNIESHSQSYLAGELPETNTWQTYQYTAGHLRSPFEKAILSQLEKPTKEQDPSTLQEEQRERQLLELYPLDSLKMVGIIQKPETTFALIRDASNNIHRVEIGAYIGQSEGRIQKIDKSGIEIKEIRYTNSMQPDEQQIILPLVLGASG